MLTLNADDMLQMLRRLVEGLTAPARNTAEVKTRSNAPEKKPQAEKTMRPDPRRRFFEDVRRYAEREGEEAPFVPMRSYWPMYENMSPAQADWYFFWRSQVRRGIFPETDEAYILICCYEILCGTGWQDPQDGYDQMSSLLKHYRAAWPRLDFILTDWLFDFSLMHALRFDLPAGQEEYEIKSPVMTDVLTAIALDDSAQEGKPVRLQFPVIAALTDYKIEESRFYRDGHALLIRHAVPRVLALVDAWAMKNGRQRPLETVSRTRPVTRKREIYTGAVCPKAGAPVTVAVVPYSQNTMLRSWLAGLIRLTENELRRLTGYRGRLRGGMPDGEIAKLVRYFLEREYGTRPEKTADAAAGAEARDTTATSGDGTAREERAPGIVLDPDKVSRLRAQSDVVREALRVDTDPAEEEKFDFEAGIEGNIQVQVIEEVTQDAPFDLEQLDGGLKELMNMLDVPQQTAVAVCLRGQDAAAQLDRLAEEMMTMPALMIDEINQAAMAAMGDILLEETEEVPEVLEEYREPLMHAWMFGA